MQKKTLSIVGVVVAIALAFISGGYLYAAQNGVGASDKKQLGLFNGNDEFIGTLVGINADGSGTEYSSYLNSENAVIRINTEGDLLYSTFSLTVNLIYFSSPNCIGNAYVESLIPSNDRIRISSQALVASGNPSRQFVVNADMVTNGVSALSSMDVGGVCTNFSSSELPSNVFPAREVNLSYAIIGKPRIKTL